MENMDLEDPKRCGWTTTDEMYIRYHDCEWGVPVHDDRKQFEFLVLESFQAGLSWITILRKREDFRRAFDNFRPVQVADFGEEDITRLMSDDRIVRNRQKIMAAIDNAKAVLRIQEEFGSFDSYIWKFVNGRTIRNSWERLEQVPAKTVESEKMSRDLASKGFRFVGPVVCYSHMQATGLVNDHITTCFRHEQCG